MFSINLALKIVERAKFDCLPMHTIAIQVRFLGRVKYLLVSNSDENVTSS